MKMKVHPESNKFPKRNASAWYLVMILHDQEPSFYHYYGFYLWALLVRIKFPWIKINGITTWTRDFAWYQYSLYKQEDYCQMWTSMEKFTDCQNNVIIQSQF